MSELLSPEDYDKALVGRSTDDQLKFWNWYSVQSEENGDEKNPSFEVAMDRVSSLKRKKFIEDAISHLNEFTIPQGVEDVRAKGDEAANAGNFFHQSIVSGREEGEIRKSDYTEPELAMELSEKTREYLKTYKSPDDEDRARIERYNNPDVESANNVGSTEESILSGIKPSIDNYSIEIEKRVNREVAKLAGDMGDSIADNVEKEHREYVRKNIFNSGTKSPEEYADNARKRFLRDRDNKKQPWTVEELKALKRKKDADILPLTDYEESVVSAAFPSAEEQRKRISESKAGKMVDAYAKHIIGSDILKNSKWEYQYVGDPSSGVKYQIRPSKEVDNTELKRFDIKLPDGKIVKLDTSSGDSSIAELIKNNISSFPKDTTGDIAKGFISSVAGIIGSTARTLEVLAAGGISALSKDVDFASAIAEGYRQTDKTGIDPVFDKFFQLEKDVKFSDYNYVKQNAGSFLNPISISQGIGQMVGQVGLAAATGGFGNASSLIGKAASAGIPMGESFLYILDNEIPEGLARGMTDEQAVYGGLVSAAAQAPVDTLSNFVALKAFGGASSPVLRMLNPRLAALAERPSFSGLFKDISIQSITGAATESFQALQDKTVEEIFGTHTDWSFDKGGVFDQAFQEGVLGGIAQGAMVALGIPFKIGAKKSAAKYAENSGGDIIDSYKANFDGKSIDVNITRLDKEIFRAGALLSARDEKGKLISETNDGESLKYYINGLSEIREKLRDRREEIDDSHLNEKSSDDRAVIREINGSHESEDGTAAIDGNDVPDQFDSEGEESNSEKTIAAPSKIDEVREKQKSGEAASSEELLKIIVERNSPAGTRPASDVESELRLFLRLGDNEPLPDFVKIHTGSDPNAPKGITVHGKTDEDGVIHLYSGSPSRLRDSEKKGKKVPSREDLPVIVAYTFMHELAKRALRQDAKGELRAELDSLLGKLPPTKRNTIDSFVKKYYKDSHRAGGRRGLRKNGIDNITNISGWDKFVNFASGFLEKIGINPNRFIGAERMAKEIAIKLLSQKGIKNDAGDISQIKSADNAASDDEGNVNSYTEHLASQSSSDKFDEGKRLAIDYIHSNEFQSLPDDYKDIILKGVATAIDGAETANQRILASLAEKLTNLSNGQSISIAKLGIADVVDESYIRLKKLVDSLKDEGVPENKAFDTPLANWVRGFLWSSEGMAMSTTEFRKIFPFRGGWDWFISVYAPYKVGMDKTFRDVQRDKKEWAEAMHSIFGKTPATQLQIKEIAIAADMTQYQYGITGSEVSQLLKRINDQHRSIENKKKITDDKFIAADRKLDEASFAMLTSGIPFNSELNTYEWNGTAQSLIDHIEHNMSSDKTRDALKKAREFGDRYQHHFSVVSMAAYGFLPPRYVNYVKRQTIGNNSRTTPKISNLGITTRESVLRDRESLPPDGYYINDVNNAVETELEEIHYELNTAIPRRVIHSIMSDSRIVKSIRGGRAQERNPVKRINEILDGIHNSFNEYRSLNGFMRAFVLSTSLGRSLQLSRVSGIFKQSLPAFISSMFQGSNEFITDYFANRDFYKKWIEDNASFLIQRLNNFDQFLQHYNDTYHAMRQSDIMRESQAMVWDITKAFAGDILTKYGIKAADIGRKISGLFTAKPDSLTARSIFISRYLHELKSRGLIKDAADFRRSGILDKESFSKASMESDEIMGSASTTQERPEFFKSRDKEKMFISSLLFALRQTDIGIKVKFAKSISRLKYIRYATSSKQAREAVIDATREAVGDFLQMASFRAIGWAYTMAVLYGFHSYVSSKIDDDDDKRKKLERNFRDQIDLYTYYAIRDAAVDAFQFASFSPGNTGNELADIATNMIAFEVWGDKASKEAKDDIAALKQESIYLEKTINAYKDSGLDKQALDAMRRQKEIDDEVRALQWKSQLKNFEDPLLGDMSITGRAAITSAGPWIRYFMSRPESETEDYQNRMNGIIKAYQEGSVSKNDVDDFAMFDVAKALDHKVDSNINMTLIKFFSASPPIGSGASAKMISKFQEELEREAIKQESNKNKKYIRTLRENGIRAEMKNLNQ